MKDKSTKSIQSYLLAAAGCIILTILDQLTKWLAVVHLKDQEPFVIWKGVFKLEYLENRGQPSALCRTGRSCSPSEPSLLYA